MTRNSMQAGDGGDRVTRGEPGAVGNPRARAYVRLHEPMSIILSKNQNRQRRERIYAGEQEVGTHTQASGMSEHSDMHTSMRGQPIFSPLWRTR